jgi:hypothetical protein
MLRCCVLAFILLSAITTAECWCHGAEPQTLMTAIAEWQYPGSKINGASLSDGATIRPSGERTVVSAVYKTVLTTKDSMDAVVQYYNAKLKQAADAEPAMPDGKRAATSGRSVTFHTDSEKRPVAIHIILVNTDTSSTTLVISRAEKESETNGTGVSVTSFVPNE